MIEPPITCIWLNFLINLGCHNGNCAARPRWFNGYTFVEKALAFLPGLLTFSDGYRFSVSSRRASRHAFRLLRFA